MIGEPIAVDILHGEHIEQVIINQALPPAFAQCWSATAESDVLLRAYSRVVKDPHFGRNTCPREEGVQVKGSAEEVASRSGSGMPSARRGHWFFGAVDFLPRTALLQEIANAIGQYGFEVFENPASRAKLLLLKRNAFMHESEMRVILVQQEQAPREVRLGVPVDPSPCFR